MQTPSVLPTVREGNELIAFTGTWCSHTAQRTSNSCAGFVMVCRALMSPKMSNPLTLWWAVLRNVGDVVKKYVPLSLLVT